MSDMIDRDAVLALFNDWLLYAPSGYSVTYEVCEAIRAIPATDARAEALKEAASHVFVLLHNTPAYVDARTLRDLVPESILALIPEITDGTTVDNLDLGRYTSASGRG